MLITGASAEGREGKEEEPEAWLTALDVGELGVEGRKLGPVLAQLFLFPGLSPLLPPHVHTTRHRITFVDTRMRVGNAWSGLCLCVAPILMWMPWEEGLCVVCGRDGWREGGGPRFIHALPDLVSLTIVLVIICVLEQ